MDFTNAFRQRNEVSSRTPTHCRPHHPWEFAFCSLHFLVWLTGPHFFLLLLILGSFFQVAGRALEEGRQAGRQANKQTGLTTKGVLLSNVLGCRFHHTWRQDWFGVFFGSVRMKKSYVYSVSLCTLQDKLSIWEFRVLIQKITKRALDRFH